MLRRRHIVARRVWRILNANRPTTDCRPPRLTLSGRGRGQGDVRRAGNAGVLNGMLDSRSHVAEARVELRGSVSVTLRGGQPLRAAQGLGTTSLRSATQGRGAVDGLAPRQRLP